MSVSASIDIRFAWRKDIPISKVNVIKKLFDFGARVCGARGRFCCLDLKSRKHENLPRVYYLLFFNLLVECGGFILTLTA
jgi:ubiquinone/menaquinone biosynthesis C-methylase UbiE